MNGIPFGRGDKHAHAFPVQQDSSHRLVDQVIEELQVFRTDAPPSAGKGDGLLVCSSDPLFFVRKSTRVVLGVHERDELCPVRLMCAAAS